MLKKFDPTVTTIGFAAIAAIAGGFAINSMAQQSNAQTAFISGAAHADTPAGSQQWAASATGRVEPKDGEVRIASQLPARIVEVLAKTNDKVQAGDLVLRLDDQDIYVRIAAAAAEAEVREREREDEKVTGPALDRRVAEDAVADAERSVFAARESFDAALRSQKIGGGSADAANTERTHLAAAKSKLEAARAAAASTNSKPGMPRYLRLESSLASARAELSGAEIALERTRIRAPSDGTILNMIGKVGETAVPSPDSALLVFGDLSGLRVRAEVEERDAAKVSIGQQVVIKADAFPDKTFEGTVTTISQSLGAPRIATRGPRRPNDVEVVEVMVALDGNPPLFTGMRVDTFFNPAAATAATPPAKTN